MVTNNIDNKIEYWKTQLLDLGKRNKMINYRETKRGTIKIIEPGFSEIFKRIVINEEELSFKMPIDRSTDSRVFSILALMETIDQPIPVNIGDIKTEGSILERQKTLKDMRSKSRLALEEQGSNILYLSCGFIQWRESESSSSQWMNSPLIMVPVSLTLKSTNAPYTLKMYEDDIVVNPTLAFRFEKDFGLTIPSYNAVEQKLDEYMDEMEMIVSRKGWRIIRETSLGLVSFLKINMYRDLDKNRQRILANPVIGAICGVSKLTNVIPTEILQFDHDGRLPSATYQVVDADSSQQDAILLSKKGISFVMQGPPGTGKSQTITNIIAEALADGKKVLFVSEKMAALNVVYKRLEEVHLADFCLTLHSNKANKREIIDQIGNTLSLQHKTVSSIEMADLDILKVEREQLNNYVKELHTDVEPLGISCYKAFSILARLNSVQDISFDLNNVTYTSRELLNEYKYLVAEYDDSIRKMGIDLRKNPWHGSNIKSVTYDLRQKIKTRLDELYKNIDYIYQLQLDVEERYNVVLKSSWESIDSTIEILDSASRSPIVPLEWLKADINELSDTCKKNSELYSCYSEMLRKVLVNYNSTIVSVNGQEIKDNIYKEINKIRKILNTEKYDDAFILNNTHGMKEYEMKLKNELEKLLISCNKIDEELSVGFKITFQNVEKLNRLIALINENPQVTEAWFKPNSNVREIFELSRKITCESNELSEQILFKYSKDILDFNASNLIEKFRNNYLKIIEYVFNFASKVKTVQGISDDATISYQDVCNFISDGLGLANKIIITIKAVERVLKATLSSLGIPEYENLKQIEPFVNICNVILSDLKPTEKWFQSENKYSIEKIISEAKAVTNTIETTTEKVLFKYDHTVFDIDFSGMLIRFKTEYTNLFKYFKGSYHSDKKAIRAAHREVLKNFKDKMAIELLQNLKIISDNKNWLENNDNILKDCLGNYYSGVDTDWSLLENKLNTFYELVNYFQYGNFPERLKEMLLNQNINMEEVKNCYVSLKELSEMNIQEKLSYLFNDFTNIETVSLESLCSKIEDIINNTNEMHKDFSLIINCKIDEDNKDKINNDNITELLEQVNKVQVNKQFLNNQKNMLVDLFGADYNIEKTDWNLIENSLVNFEKIKEILPESKIPNKIKNLLLKNTKSMFNLNELFEETKVDIVKDLITRTKKILKNANIDQLKIKQLIAQCEQLELSLNSILVECSKLTEKLFEKRSAKEVMDDLELIIKLEKIQKQEEENQEEYKENYRDRYIGMDTDWNQISKDLLWTKDFYYMAFKYNISHDFIKRVCTEKGVINSINLDVLKLKKFQNDSNEDFSWFNAMFEEEEHIEKMPLDELAIRCNECSNSIALLEAWVDYSICKSKCVDAKLGDFIDKVGGSVQLPDTMVEVFEKRFYRLWIDSISTKFPSVFQFRRRAQDARIEKFRQLDEKQLQTAQYRIREKLISNLPSRNITFGLKDEMAILLHELNKKKRIMPIRKLFNAIPNLLMKLKPCLMMSPLSVSYYLEAENYSFDMVLFDEASQVFPEDAIGAIFRGAQIVIAGDSKQLPPTNFFSSNSSNTNSDYDGNEDEEDIPVYESILEQTENCLPNRNLLWHYRSRDEHLIAFSNQEIYKNTLTTFPGNRRKFGDSGVEYIYVENGLYESEDKKNRNIEEARKVVELIKEHIQKHHNRSLGVISFSKSQQSAIETVLQEFIDKNPLFQDFFQEDKEEPFFIKNLENVQGDERDTIILSICYAKDSKDKPMRMNIWGPLGKSGGERRLNVAITRAKYNIKIVGSILPSDIDLNRTNSKGVQMLRSYIEFAMNGEAILRSADNKIQSKSKSYDFENVIRDFLMNAGYKVVTGLGCSDYKIDIAIEHPYIEGRFVIGIECDGEIYWKAKTARDRDRLRQSVLEKMGWTMYRVWSTDWIKDPHAEGEKLLQVVEKSISDFKNEAAVTNVSRI